MASDRDDNLSAEELDKICRFIEEMDTDLVTDDLRELVEKHWPWLLAKLGEPNPPINPSGSPALSESEAKAFVEGVETAQDVMAALSFRKKSVLGELPWPVPKSAATARTRRCGTGHHQ